MCEGKCPYCKHNVFGHLHIAGGGEHLSTVGKKAALFPLRRLHLCNIDLPNKSCTQMVTDEPRIAIFSVP